MSHLVDALDLLRYLPRAVRRRGDRAVAAIAVLRRGVPQAARLLSHVIAPALPVRLTLAATLLTEEDGNVFLPHTPVARRRRARRVRGGNVDDVARKCRFRGARLRARRRARGLVLVRFPRKVREADFLAEERITLVTAAAAAAVVGARADVLTVLSFARAADAGGAVDADVAEAVLAVA